jgi:hypothetical protein
VQWLHRLKKVVCSLFISMINIFTERLRNYKDNKKIRNYFWSFKKAFLMNSLSFLQKRESHVSAYGLSGGAQVGAKVQMKFGLCNKKTLFLQHETVLYTFNPADFLRFRHKNISPEYFQIEYSPVCRR